MVKRREDLTSPRSAGRRLDVSYDSDAFGRFTCSGFLFGGRFGFHFLDDFLQ